MQLDNYKNENTHWGGDGALSTTQVREIVDPRTKWNSSDEPGLSMWALGLTTVTWKTNEWGPFAEDIWKLNDVIAINLKYNYDVAINRISYIYMLAWLTWFCSSKFGDLIVLRT